MPGRLSGIHHVSALSANIQRSHDFFTRILGMRLVIRTVNQDAPSMYHLFFGDGAGTPGSDMTVFDMPGAKRELRGNNAITLTTFRIHGEDAFVYWRERFAQFGVVHSGIIARDGRRAIDFEDWEGTQLSLIEDDGMLPSFPWRESTVPTEYQIRGLGYVVIMVPTLNATDRFLTDALQLHHHHEYPLADAPEFRVHVYQIGDGGAHAEVHVIVRDDLPRTRYGAGGVHHVALRVPEGESIDPWVAHIDARGFMNSGIVDRHYFTSLYVREPNHVLFELATDGPGFAVDAPLDGNRLSLPPKLEPEGATIERVLAPLETDSHPNLTSHV